MKTWNPADERERLSNVMVYCCKRDGFGRPGDRIPNGKIRCHMAVRVVISATNGVMFILRRGKMVFASSMERGLVRGGRTVVINVFEFMVARTPDNQCAGYPSSCR